MDVCQLIGLFPLRLIIEERPLPRSYRLEQDIGRDKSLTRRTTPGLEAAPTGPPLGAEVRQPLPDASAPLGSLARLPKRFSRPLPSGLIAGRPAPTPRPVGAAIP